jgi:hypothetical protein
MILLTTGLFTHTGEKSVEMTLSTHLQNKIPLYNFAEFNYHNRNYSRESVWFINEPLVPSN